MADLIDRTDAIARKEWSSDLKSYVVTIKELRRLPRAKTEADSDREALKFLFNRCFAVISCFGSMCVFCGLREKCEKTRTVSAEQETMETDC